ncbi:MAG: sialidase family protein, partial [Planctomycetaceae bacterium]
MQGPSQIKRALVLVATLLTVVTLPTSQATYGQAKSVPASAFGPSLQVGDVDDVGEVGLVVSPTGAVAAFVPTRRWPGHEGKLWMAYRVSADGGRTWTGQLEAPMPDRSAPVVGRGRTATDHPTGVNRRIGPWEHMIRPPIWFSARYARFSNDLMSYQVEALKAEVPQAIVLAKEPNGVTFRTQKVLPLHDQNEVLRLSKSELLLAMHGRFKGETRTRTFLIQSLDGGRLWRTFTTIGYAAEDPDPQLPGEFAGFTKPSMVALPGGKLLAVMRSDLSRKPPFRPLYFSWSENRGANWSQPKPTRPHLFAARPKLVALDGGLLACLVEQPGPAIAFSTDDGRSWSRSQAIPGAVTRTTGLVDMARVGPGRLLVLAAAKSGGIRVFPITVGTNTPGPKKTKTRPTKPTEILKITQGKSVKLGPYGYVNDATLGVSPTGVIAAAVGVRKWPGMHEQWITYRLSRDGGKTWSESLQGFGPVRSGAESWATLRGGGVLQVGGWRISPVENRKGWWRTILTRFSNDMIRYQIEPVRVFMPDAGFVISEPSPLFMSGPHFGTGRVIQLPNGDLLSPMQGKFQGDTKYRVFVTRSVDRGRTWRFLGTIAYIPKDPQPELAGQYVGHAEGSIALLPNGQMLSVMRTQYTQMTGEYRPLNASWSDDLGKTWTRPVPTSPHLMAIHPNLIVLDNGVVACVYGRPGFHAGFSIDNG